MAGHVVEPGKNQQIYPLLESTTASVETGTIPPIGEMIPRDHPENLSVLLDIIDSMPDDMLSVLHDDLPRKRDDL